MSFRVAESCSYEQRKLIFHDSRITSIAYGTRAMESWFLTQLSDVTFVVKWLDFGPVGFSSAIKQLTQLSVSQLLWIYYSRSLKNVFSFLANSVSPRYNSDVCTWQASSHVILAGFSDSVVIWIGVTMPNNFGVTMPTLFETTDSSNNTGASPTTLLLHQCGGRHQAPLWLEPVEKAQGQDRSSNLVRNSCPPGRA